MSRRRELAGAAVWAAIIQTSPAAFAEEPAAPVVVGARLAQDGVAAKLVFDLSQPVEARASALASPDRIVVDLPQVNFALDPSVGRNVSTNEDALVKAFRFGLLAPGRSRIVIDLAHLACPSNIESKLIAEGAPASRLKIELRPCDAAAFAALEQSAAASTADALASNSAPPPVVVVDPGHGGVDGGAHGVGGAVEKTLVWDFCNELRRQLEATGKYTIVMTRDGDQYVDLDDRVTIARDANAALFISVHADTLSEGADVNGSTVYTAADRASDAEAARIAARENAADRSPTKERKAQDDPGVADILFDLKRRETRAYAHIFSRGLVEKLRGAARLNHNPERSAGFVVLKAPEFPSVLVELGYLSNVQDVLAMNSPIWRAKAATAMVEAIDAFFAAPAKGSDSGVALGAGQISEPTR
jgi:N-acetylmuramoyl-L-alanine amidase